MPAPDVVGPRERITALAGVILVQLVLAIVLVRGLRVDALPGRELISHLIEVALPPKPPPPIPVSRPKPHPVVHHLRASPKAAPKPIGGSPGPRPTHSLPAPTPVVQVHPTATPSGGGSGSGPAAGSGAGGGTGGQGLGADDGGGTDLVQIAGEIRPSDYPQDLRGRNLGGRVSILFTVGTDGRVTSCTVTHSSGVQELDQLTCRLIEQRFRYRPSTDRYGRPIPDEVEGVQDWVAQRG